MTNQTAPLPRPAVEKSTTSASSAAAPSVPSVPVGVTVDEGATVATVPLSSGVASGSTPPSGAAFSMTNVMTPRPSGSPSVLLTCQRAVHVPRGSGSDDRDRQRGAVVEDLGPRQRDRFGLAVDRDRVRLAELVGEADHDLVGRHVERRPVGRRGIDDRVLGRCHPRTEADECDDREENGEHSPVQRDAPAPGVRRRVSTPAPRG